MKNLVVQDLSGLPTSCLTPFNVECSMKRLLRFVLLLPAAISALLFAGCYTQLGTVRSDEDSEEVTQQEETSAYNDSLAGSGDEEYEESEYESSDRYYPFPYYYYPPVYGGAGYYDPWYWGSSFYCDPFRWGPWVTVSYWPGYYYHRPYYSPYHGYYPVYSYDGTRGHGSTRTIGSSRGSGSRTGGVVLGRDGVAQPGVSRPSRSGDRSLPPVTLSPRAPATKGRTTGGEKGKSVDSGKRTSKPRSVAKPSAPNQRPAPTTRDGDKPGSRGGSEVSKPAPPRPSSSPQPSPQPSGGGRSRGGSPRSGPRN